MKCSVVMTTYNGEKFVEKQMESLRLQKRVPDEVLIFDDRSTDNTAEIVKGYIEKYSLYNWKFIINEKNMGWKANFMQGLEKASGDILFPCDQDDYWMSEKIKLMAAAMENHDEIAVLACDTQIEYGEGAVHSKHYDGAETKDPGAIAQYPLTSRFFMTPRPGCTYAIKKIFFDDIKDYWQDDFPHDEYMWIVAALSGTAFFINKELVEFHRHSDNNSDIRYKDINMQKKQLDYIDRSLHVFTKLVIDKKIFPLPQAEKMIHSAIVWCNKRKQLMETRNPIRWFLMMPWWKYYNSNRNMLSDLYLIIFGAFKR